MRNLYLIFILFVSVGCDEPTGIVLTITEACGVSTDIRNEVVVVVMKSWSDSEEGPISFDCVYEMYKYDVICADKIKDMCSMSKSRYGCVKDKSYLIYLSRLENNLTNLETLGHEYIHVVQLCIDGRIDKKHRSGTHWIKTGGDESIEAKVFEEIYRRYSHQN